MTAETPTDKLPKDWTPQADSDPQWQAIAAVLRAPAEPRLPGEARWADMRANIWREAGIGEPASVVPIAAESLARPRYTARLIQIAAVGVAAFALGWFLSPASTGEVQSPQIAMPTDTVMPPADPDKIVVTHGELSPRVTPTLTTDGAVVPVTSETAPGATPRHVVIRDGGGLQPVSDQPTPGDLLPQFIRTLRAQPDHDISADAILESIDTLLSENPTPAVESSLRFLRAEVLLLEKRDNAAAMAEYEAILRLTNNQGALAENARSRLASLR